MSSTTTCSLKFEWAEWQALFQTLLHLPILHVSRFEVIPKCNQPGKWPLILDLSSTAGHSVNDSIAWEDCSLHYMKVDDISAGVMQVGWDKLIGKCILHCAHSSF